MSSSATLGVRREGEGEKKEKEREKGEGRGGGRMKLLGGEKWG